MTKQKLTPDERRELILSALSGVPVLQLSKEYGVARSWIYALKEEAMQDPVSKADEARRELRFRQSVRTLAALDGVARSPKPR